MQVEEMRLTRKEKPWNWGGGGGGGGAFPCISYIGMCGTKGYRFNLAILVCYRE